MYVYGRESVLFNLSLSCHRILSFSLFFFNTFAFVFMCGFYFYFHYQVVVFVLLNFFFALLVVLFCFFFVFSFVTHIHCDMLTNHSLQCVVFKLVAAFIIFPLGFLFCLAVYRVFVFFLFSCLQAHAQLLNNFVLRVAILFCWSKSFFFCFPQKFLQFSLC